MSLNLPAKVPEPGFYYHYKHDPSGAVNNYAYEFVGVGFHTEVDEKFVIYKPLYDASVSKAAEELGVECFDTRPLEMWMGDIEKDGRVVKRFTKITDPAVIAALEEVSKQR